MSSPIKALFLLISLTCYSGVWGQNHNTNAANPGDTLLWDAGTSVNIGNGTFAPYYISALTHGTVTQSKGWLAHSSIRHTIQKEKRFSWGAGMEIFGGIASEAKYLKWASDGITYTHGIHPSYIWIQQLYGELKYRGIFIEAGMKEHGSPLLDNSLTSGDWVESGNARPIPQIRLGFIDFQDIPFTKGWVQIQGELAYGKFIDNSWLKDFYSRGNSHINTGSFYLYRRLYFRTKPSENFSLTLGLQAAGMIGGKTQYWDRGRMVREEDLNVSFGKMLLAIIPGKEGDEAGQFVTGSTLGCWDINGRYNIPGGHGVLHAYLQKPWEKGSSLGFMNGWDGLWGLEYEFKEDFKPITAVLFEYIYLMNQSGPVHFSIHDFPGTTIPYESQGRDNYYNNHQYNSYVNYGVGIGSPFLKAPIYNLSGYPMYMHNLVKGFHLAAKGRVSPFLCWKAAISYKEGYGNGEFPSIKKVTDFSWLVEFTGHFKKITPLHLKIQIASDHGNYLGNNFGVYLGAVYKGAFSFR